MAFATLSFILVCILLDQTFKQFKERQKSLELGAELQNPACFMCFLTKHINWFLILAQSAQVYFFWLELDSIFLAGTEAGLY